MGLTETGSNLFLDMLFGGNQAAPGTYYLGVVTQEPDLNDDGSDISEPSGGAYARVAMANASSLFSAADSGQKTTLNALAFPEATADWGTLTHFVICDASSAGNLLAWGRLTSPIQIVSGRTLFFAADQMTITATGG